MIKTPSFLSLVIKINITTLSFPINNYKSLINTDYERFESKEVPDDYCSISGQLRRTDTVPLLNEASKK